MSFVTRSRNAPLFQEINPDGDSMFDPKWFVGGFALGGLALIFSYSAMIGTTIAAALVILAILVLSLRLWLASEPGGGQSERELLFSRLSRSTRNRRNAREKELGAKRGPDAR